MAWFKVDDRFHTSKKLMSIPKRHRLAAAGLWAIAGAWCADQLTDGHVPDYIIEVFGGTKAVVDSLVSAGLWERESQGFVFYNWHEYQPSRRDVEDERNASKERMRDLRARRKDSKPQDSNVSSDVFGRTGEECSENVRNPVPSRPVPTRPSTSNDVLAPPTPSEPRNVRLPKDWEPTKEHQERALNAGIDLNVELEKFKAHAGENDRHAKNWNQAFTRWLINAGEYVKRDKARGGRMTYSERQEAHWQAELANAKAFEAKQNQTTLGALGK